MKIRETINWPTVEDKQPKVSVFNVPRSSLLADKYIPGVHSFKTTESTEDIELRLRRSSLAYRAVSVIRGIIKKSEDDYEV